MNYHTLNKTELRELLISKKYNKDDYFTINSVWEEKFKESLKTYKNDALDFMKKTIREFNKKCLKEIDNKHVKINTALSLHVEELIFNSNCFFDNNTMQVSILLDSLSNDKVDCSDLVFVVDFDEDGKVISGEFMWV